MSYSKPFLLKNVPVESIEQYILPLLYYAYKTNNQQIASNLLNALFKGEITTISSDGMKKFIPLGKEQEYNDFLNNLQYDKEYEGILNVVKRELEKLKQERQQQRKGPFREELARK